MDCAVYARQSVEKANSLSIEGQIDLCRRCAGRDLRIYTDRGYSGKNTKRPDFQRLMGDIRSGRIEKLFVYRLDRFSRSVSDFGRLWETLREHHVEFVSVSENFDTSTPMGRAMLHIIMVFAQLERETTSERVRDNYYKRASLGAWPGGPAPYGFQTGRAISDNGRSIPTLIPDPRNAQIVKRIFELYAEEEETLGTVVRKLNGESISAPKRDTWDNVSLSRILHCPAYVKADKQVQLYYRSLGIPISSPPECFDGVHGLLLVGKKTTSQGCHEETRTLSVLNSEGIVKSALWLKCQEKLRRNRQIGNSGKGTHTWLTGLIKCSECGYSVKVSAAKNRRYLLCSGRYNLAKCSAEIQIDLTALENVISNEIQTILDAFPLTCPDQSEESDTYRKALEELDRKAARLIGAFSESTEVTASYLNRALMEIENERQGLAAAYQRKQRKAVAGERISMDKLSFQEKKLVASRFVQKICVSGETALIIWKI